jgi:hypothetical protein
MPWVGFELTIPAFEQAKTFHTLDRAATVIDILTVNGDYSSSNINRLIFVMEGAVYVMRWRRDWSFGMLCKWTGGFKSPINCVKASTMQLRAVPSVWLCLPRNSAFDIAIYFMATHFCSSICSFVAMSHSSALRLAKWGKGGGEVETKGHQRIVY